MILSLLVMYDLYILCYTCDNGRSYLIAKFYFILVCLFMVSLLMHKICKTHTKASVPYTIVTMDS